MTFRYYLTGGIQSYVSDLSKRGNFKELFAGLSLGMMAGFGFGLCYSHLYGKNSQLDNSSIEITDSRTNGDGLSDLMEKD